MSSNEIDCSAIEQRINGHNLYISTTQDQINKLDPHDSDVQNKRDALTRKLNNLHEQLDILQHALENCRQGKGANFPDFEIVSEGDAG
jgi:chromosome segregation ATPase